MCSFTAGSSRDSEPTMPDSLLDGKHELVDDWRHVDTVCIFLGLIVKLKFSS